LIGLEIHPNFIAIFFLSLPDYLIFNKTNKMLHFKISLCHFFGALIGQKKMPSNI